MLPLLSRTLQLTRYLTATFTTLASMLPGDLVETERLLARLLVRHSQPGQFRIGELSRLLDGDEDVRELLCHHRAEPELQIWLESLQRSWAPAPRRSARRLAEMEHLPPPNRRRERPEVGVFPEAQFLVDCPVWDVLPVSQHGLEIHEHQVVFPVAAPIFAMPAAPGATVGRSARATVREAQRRYVSHGGAHECGRRCIPRYGEAVPANQRSFSRSELRLLGLSEHASRVLSVPGVDWGMSVDHNYRRWRRLRAEGAALDQALMDVFEPEE